MGCQLKKQHSGSNDVVRQLALIDDMALNIRTMVPFQVLADIDNARNPMQLTKERLERAATENQFMNGKIAAIEVRVLAVCTLESANATMHQSYRELLNKELARHFPETVEYLNPRPVNAADQ